MRVNIDFQVVIPDTAEERATLLAIANRYDDNDAGVTMDQFNDVDTGEFDASEWAMWVMDEALADNNHPLYPWIRYGDVEVEDER